MLGVQYNDGGKDTKETKNIVEEEKPVFWNWYAESGFESEYNFRGVDLTPGAAGAAFLDVELSKWNFTLGLYEIRQFGTASANTWALGEGGGGGTGSSKAFGGLLTLDPTTTQGRFNEIDLFIQYHLAIGPVDVTFGNIAFFVEREASTTLDVFLLGVLVNHFSQVPTVEDEQFDRLFIRLSTSKIPHIQPLITYYQTVLNRGQDPFRNFLAPPTGIFPPERNTENGGYLEGRLRGNFQVTHWLDFNPYGFVSYSFHDRTEPIANAETFRDIVRGRSLVGFNNAQVGLELPIHISHQVGVSTTQWAPPDVRFNLVPFFAYSYHISDPPAGTDRNEVWGGGKITISF